MSGAREGVTLALLACGVLLAALDQGIVVVALDALGRAFGVSAAWSAWVISLYSLGMAVSVPITGKLADRFGPKRLFLVMLGLFSAGSLLVALSQQFLLLLAARLIQSLGGGGLFVVASTYVLLQFPAARHGRAIGLLSATMGFGNLLGPVLGAWLLGSFGDWRWLFLLNIPIAAITAALAAVLLRDRKSEGNVRLDWTGVTLLTALILALMGMAIVEAGGWLLAGGSVVLAWLLVRQEHRCAAKGEDPLLPRELLGDTTFRHILVFAFSTNSVLAAILFLPGYVHELLHVPVVDSGYWLVPFTLAAIVGAYLGGRAVDRGQSLPTLRWAALLSAGGLLIPGLIVPGPALLMGALGLMGIGFGMMTGAPLNVLASQRAAPEAKGVGLGVVSMARRVAMSLLPAWYAVLLTAGAGQSGDYSSMFVVAALVTLAGAGWITLIAKSDAASAVRAEARATTGP